MCNISSNLHGIFDSPPKNNLIFRQVMKNITFINEENADTKTLRTSIKLGQYRCPMTGSL